MTTEAIFVYINTDTGFTTYCRHGAILDATRVHRIYVIAIANLNPYSGQLERIYFERFG